MVWQQVIFSDLPEDFENLALVQCTIELYEDERIAVPANFLHLTVVLELLRVLQSSSSASSGFFLTLMVQFSGSVSSIAMLGLVGYAKLSKEHEVVEGCWHVSSIETVV